MSDYSIYKYVVKKFQNHNDLYVIKNTCGITAFSSKKILSGISHQFICGISDMLENYSYNVDEKRIIAALDRIREYHIIADKELCSLSDVITILVLRKLYSCEDDTFSACIKLLHFLNKYDFNAVYRAVSDIDRAFSENENCVYRYCDDKTKRLYRLNCIKNAAKNHISEYESALLLGDRSGAHTENTILKRLYFPLIYFSAMLFALLYTVLAKNILIGILLYIPLTEAMRYTVDYIYGKIISPSPLCSYDLKDIPDDAKTLVVITSLVCGGESDRELIKNIEKYYLTNTVKNCVFGLLADIGDSPAAENESDVRIIDNLKNEIDRLNLQYGNIFYLFYRGRIFDNCQNKYIASERKRGAILSLCRFVKNHNSDMTVHGENIAFIHEIKYIITLDSDTDIGIENVKKLVGKMYYPYNRPIISGGIVVRGYGVMQPKMETSPKSSQRNFFTSLMSGAPGHDLYQSAFYETYQSLFGEGIFCGKGIFDVDAYISVCDDAFAPNTVLSHDLLEGTRLRAAFLSDIAFTDGVPKNPITYYKRMHRWIRGDIQALAYIGSHVKNAHGEKTENPISTLSKYKLFDNFRRICVPIFTTAIIILCSFYNDLSSAAGILISVGYIILPYFITLFNMPSDCQTHFYSHIMTPVKNSFFEACYRLAALIYEAYISSDAVLRSLYRMTFSHKKLLEWTAASEADKINTDKISAYIYKMPISYTAGIILMFMPSYLCKIFGILWFFMPLISHRIAKPYKTQNALSGIKKDKLIANTLDMWNYYSELVTPKYNFLPPDNIQFLPANIIAERTSPTNIGLYLLSCAAAADFGFITKDEMLSRIEHTVETVEKLGKCHGHLYNWYNISNLNIIGEPYISTVDSGNFIASLTALYDAVNEPLKIRISEIIKNTDFSFLYDEKHDMFFIGYDEIQHSYSENHYDNYASEFLTTAYYALAAGYAPRKCFDSLSRRITSDGRHIGIVSWTGTMFEYLMPRLFLPSPIGTLEYEMLLYAIEKQTEKSADGIWGISESGYYNFDSQMNYQYKAFGIEKLGMARGLSANKVISPYSSYLAMMLAPDLSYQNIEKMSGMDLYGKYGLYEAIDYTPKRVGSGYAVIKSYMAHHIGMSIVASANVCFDDIFVKRFLSTPKMYAYAELLSEKIPMYYVQPQIQHDIHDDNKVKRDNAHLLDGSALKESGVLKTYLLSNNKSKIIASSEGKIYFSDGGSALTYPCFDGDSIRSLKLLCMSTDNKVVDITSGEIRCNRDEIQYIKDDYTMTLCVSGNSSCYKIDIAASQTEFSPTLILDPVIAPVKDYLAHPAFMSLSIECEYAEHDKILIFTRRPRRESEKYKYLAAALCRTDRDFSFESRRDEVLCLNYSYDDILRLASAELKNTSGACINPICVMRTIKPCHNAQFIISCSSSRKEAVNLIRNARSLGCGNIRPVILARYALAAMDSGDVQISEMLFNLLIRRLSGMQGSCTLDKAVPQKNLWSYGISGDYRMICVSLDSKFYENKQICRDVMALIKSHLYYTVSGFRFELIFIFEEHEKYHSPASNELYELINECGSGHFISRDGGIYVIRTQKDINLFSGVADIFLSLDDRTNLTALFEHYSSTLICGSPRERILKSNEKISGESSFTENGYRIVKGTQRAPWSYIYASHGFGTLITQNSLGFTWYKNSGEGRLTPWNNDMLREQLNESVIYYSGNDEYDLCSVSHTAEYTHSCGIYTGIVNEISYKVYAGIDTEYPVKLVLVQFDRNIDVKYSLTPCIGSSCVKPNMIKEYCDNGTVFYRNMYSADFSEMYMFVSSLHFENYAAFTIGVASVDNDSLYRTISEKYSNEKAFLDEFEKYALKSEKLFSQLTVSTNNDSFDKMINYFIPYQAIYTRMFARTGFYQSSGAYGFRDQLQDSLAALLCDSSLTKYQILRCAAHQYEEGDAMHWWHHTHGPDKGVRTKCSDDYLWLPYAVSLYVSHTGDESILDSMVRFLKSSPLGSGERERYEIPHKSDIKECIYTHCIKAIYNSFRFGRHGMPLIGICDWNDGMNAVGDDGYGESVWLAFFLRIVLKNFIPICISRSDTINAEKFNEIELSIKDSLEINCYDSDRYLRAFFDNGQPIGSHNSSECAIDILPQAFAAVCDGKNERTVTALDSAYEYLYDDEYKLFKLFSPPFDNRGQYPGYISGYVPGIRENGGQYSHAAVWAAWGYASIGDYERAYEIFMAINPALRTQDNRLAEIYRVEPYVFAGDVYANHDHYGRGGWSHYTGAAAWYYRIFVTELLGYKEYGGENGFFTITPHLCSKLSEMKISLNFHDTEYEIKIAYGEKLLYICDGKIVNNKFYFDKIKHFIEIKVEK